MSSLPTEQSSPQSADQANDHMPHIRASEVDPHLTVDEDRIDPEPAAMADDGNEDLRTATIHKYVDTGLRSPNLLAANLTALVGDLFELALDTKRIVSRHMPREDADLHDHMAVAPALESILRLCKQIGSFSNVLIKIEGSDK